MSTSASAARTMRRREALAQILARGSGIELIKKEHRNAGSSRQVSKAASMDAAMPGGPSPADSGRAQLSDVERFMSEQGLNLPPRELAERFNLYMADRRSITSQTAVDRAVRSAISSNTNVPQSAMAIRYMVRTGALDHRVGAAIQEWMTLLRSGTFRK